MWRQGPSASGEAAYAFQPFPVTMGLRNSRFLDPRSHSDHDNTRHITKGNTHTSLMLAANAKAEYMKMQRQKASWRVEQRRRQAAALKRQHLLRSQWNPPATVDVVAGRHHVNMQTEPYLEVLEQKPEKVNGAVQTDALLDRPPTPPYVPFKTGRDAETQIEEGELFNFDIAVDAMLDVIIGKTLEQAMLEVNEEDELEEMRRQQEAFEQRRREELLETRRLEEAERRKYEEKERRIQQELEGLRQEKKTQEKLQARLYAKSFINNLEDQVFGMLEDEGWFRDALQHEVEVSFYPWLTNAMIEELDKHRKARDLVDALIREVVVSQLKV